MDVEVVTALLALWGALTGTWALVGYARHTAYEKAAGELSAKRRVELIESFAGLLNEALEVLTELDGGPTTRFKSRESSQMLDDFESKLALARVYLEEDLATQLSMVYVWTVVKLRELESRAIETRGLTEPDYHKVWDLLIDAAHAKPRRPWRLVRWWKRRQYAQQLAAERAVQERRDKEWAERVKAMQEQNDNKRA